MLNKALVSAIICLFLGAGVIPSVVGNEPIFVKTIYVDDDNTNGPWDGSQEHPYQFIQDGIDAANDGDTIFVYSGIYYENVIVDKTINLIGEDRDNTIIDGGESADVVYVKSDMVTINGFSITNSSDTGDIGSGDAGIELTSSFNKIESCKIFSNNCYGVLLSCSNNNIIQKNEVFENDWGFCLNHSSYNTIVRNSFSHNGWLGLNFLFSPCNTIVNNTFENDGMNIWLSDELRDYYQNVDSNTVNGKPFYYLLNESGLELNEVSVGQIYLINCTDCIISNIEVSDTVLGIEVDYSSNITILNSKFKNTVGNAVVSSSNCTIIGNEISNTDWDAMQIWNSHNTKIISNDFLNNEHGIMMRTMNGWEPSYGNLIFHNNFINNSVQAFDSGINSWDDGYPSGGNYWDDYTGSDSDGDGIGDVSYNLHGDNNKDRYPLMKPWVNDAPCPPAKPSGPTSGKVGKVYTYTSSTTDPDGDQVYYKWDWGDETSGWDGPYDSGETADASHIWDEKGDYSIKVKAKDVHGEESPWSDPLGVSMPKNKAINNPFLLFLERLIERFPILARLLQLPVFKT